MHHQLSFGFALRFCVEIKMLIAALFKMFYLPAAAFKITGAVPLQPQTLKPVASPFCLLLRKNIKEKS